MLIFDPLLYVTQCYTDCSSYFLQKCGLSFCVIRKPTFRFCYNMEKNVNCPDTVGNLEIIYVLRVYIVADQSTLFASP